MSVESTMVPILLAALALVTALTCAGWTVFALTRALRGVSDAAARPQTPVESPKLVELAAEVAELQVAVKGLPSLWEEERERADRAYSRARAARSAAERATRGDDERDEDEGEDDYPHSGVQPLHVGVGNGGGVQPVPEVVAAPSLADLRRKATDLGF